ncbi:MAG: 4-hydroxy-3-methylbut-2-enyl diphosphate reductase [Candidatus Melainabacteria bacterium]|nr:4-hydroxy-3-methylbut-2-enyl diphosphate reductase [Candidatus Melainabacteria bacterium]MBI3308302.1 4-hydroxy-3-methylbut-2-enyl diphosphate reductase [Candidatus Melainabacteria bacterium]
MVKKVVLASLRGFCAGVIRAIDIVDLALDKLSPPIYVRHEIVHNEHVKKDFESRGVVFVDELSEVPDGNCVILSAHGSEIRVFDEAKKRKLTVVDATCPLVIKVHMEMINAWKKGYKVIYIGHEGHQEVIGAMSNIASDSCFLVGSVNDVAKLPKDLGKIFIATQTTLSIDDTKEIINKLKERYQEVETPSAQDICYATQNRQDAVKELAKVTDYILVIGSKNSSNSNRLVEVAKGAGVDAELVPDPYTFEVSKKLFGKIVGVTSGASAPEVLVETLIKKLNAPVETLQSREENVNFKLPHLQDLKRPVAV